MYTRLIILTAIVVLAVCGLGGLGFHAIEKWSQGLEGARLGEFAEVAEQVRQDVKRKLDEFMRAEQQRKYTDYLYSYVPENIVDAEQLPLLRSPLGEQLSNSFAYGYFQIEPDGNIVTPYYQDKPPAPDERNAMARAVQDHFSNVRENVLPSVRLRAGDLRLPASRPDAVEEDKAPPAVPSAKENAAPQVPTGGKGLFGRRGDYPIESLSQEAQQAQVYRQQRSIAASNQMQAQVPPQQPLKMEQGSDWTRQNALSDSTQTPAQQTEGITGADPVVQEQRAQTAIAGTGSQGNADPVASDTVQIRIEPFLPLVVPDPGRAQSIFGGQVFLLRHVQIESRRLLQGFQLDEKRLIGEVEASARSFVRDGMGFELPQVRKVNGQAGSPDEEAAYTAILAFGFGDLILDLTELDPAWITRRVGELHHIYLGIIATVVAAVALSLLSLWHNVRAQAALARKKDDFISAVSHELRTPLTSIRMYTEMLEKNWVKSKDKVAEYYRTMRQESERLSRLVENVLDFARLQKGRKNYAFRLGSIDECIAPVVEMMRPYAEQHGFAIRTDLAAAGQACFDRDAVTQIVVNLVDNAVKYARCAADKTIVVRTRDKPGLTIIEIEDHGPGIPYRQRKRVFEQFYRCEDETPCQRSQPGRPQTTGMGLGLTLVKRFAEAHGGSVEIDSAEPTGAILRVSLAAHLPVAD